MSASEPANDLRELQTLLEQRLAIIGDTALRDSDPEAQLSQLQRVSEALVEKHGEMKAKGTVQARLDHFLSQCSYGKALEWIGDKLQP